MKKNTLFLVALFTLFSVGVSYAQQTAEEIAKKVANPISHMISLPFQTNFQFNINTAQGGENGYKVIMNIQPILPFVLSENLNLISRVIIPVITQKDVNARNQMDQGVGDILYTGFFSPSNSKIIWGVGPTLSLPTATNDFLGSKKLSLGFSAVALGQPGKWTVGALVNQLWSVAGDKDRSDIRVSYFQPFAGYRFKGGLSAGVSSENTYDWNRKQLVSGAVAFNMSQIIRISTKQLASIQFSPLIYYGNAEIKLPTWGIRTSLAFLFPGKAKPAIKN